MDQVRDMGPVWVEILDRHLNVSSRIRMEGASLRVGRAYDNDVVLDDPYVAAHHLEVERTPDGTVLLRDLGSLNGTRVRKSVAGRWEALDEAALGPDAVVAIGRSRVRFRSSTAPTAPELRLPADEGRHHWFYALGGVLVFTLLEVLYMWLRQTETLKLVSYLSPLAGLLGWVLGWAAGWAVLSRLFTGLARFDRHLWVAVLGVTAYSFADELFELAGFALLFQVPELWMNALNTIIVGVVVLTHLLLISPARPVLKSLLVLAMGVAGLGLSHLDQSEQQSSYGDSLATILKPAWLQWRAPVGLEAALESLSPMRQDLNRWREQEPGQGGPGEDDDD